MNTEPKTEDKKEITSVEKTDDVNIEKVSNKKKKKFTPFLRGNKGQIHIKATYNNTIVTVSDLNGSVLAWGSAGKNGFKGPKKSTPYAAGAIVKSIIEKVKENGIKEVDVFVKGTGNGREAGIRAIETNGIKIASIKDISPIPHGGCRPKKRRRI
jgi:small subunit ribosomal protein S11